VTNDGSQPNTFAAGNAISLLGPSNLGYEWLSSQTCFDEPNPFDVTTPIFPGGSLSGNLCFTVLSTDATALEAFDNLADSSANWTYFALQ